MLAYFQSYSQIALDTSQYIDFQNVHLTHYSTKNALDQNSIGAFTVDKDGILWGSTELSLFSFDGDCFTLDYPYRGQKHMAKDSDGNLRIKGATSKNGQLIPDSLNHKNIYIGLRGMHLFLDSLDNDFTLKELYKAGVACKTKSGDLYGNSPNEILYFNGHTWDTIYPKRVDRLSSFTSDSSFYFLDDEHYLWKFTKGKFIAKYSLEHFSPDLSIIWNYNPFATYFFDRGRLFRFKEIKGVPTLQLWMKNVNVAGLHRVLEMTEVDSSSIFFLGSRTNGFYYGKPKILQSKGLTTNDGETNIVYSHVSLNGDSLLTGSGVVINDQGAYQKFNEQNLSSRNLFKDSKGRIWTTYQDKTAEISYFVYLSPENGFKPKRIGSDIFKHINEDDKGTIWGTSKDSLYQFDETEKLFKAEIALPKNLSEGAKDLYFNPFTSELWLLNRNTDHKLNFKYSNNRWQAFSFSKNSKPRTKFYHFSDENTVWITTKKDGFYAYYNDSLYILPLDEKKYLQNPHCILEDDNGYFWISCNQGVFQASKADLMAYIRGETEHVYYYYWGLNDGIEGYELNGNCTPCGIKLNSGNFSFPSLNGVVQFNPSTIHPILPTYPINITGFKINDRDTLITQEQKLDADIELLEFKISAPYFGEKVNQGSLEYYLEGLHHKWHSVRSDKLISFGNLSHGRYTLKIRRMKGFGVNNYSIVEYPFSIQEFYYETTLFKVLATISIFLIMSLLFYIQSLLELKRRKKLEHIIVEKTEDYRRLNTTLRNNLSELNVSQEALKKILEDKDRMMAIYAHDVRGPLKHMVYMAERNEEKHEELSKNDVKRWFSVIAKTANGIYDQTERMFHWISGQSNGMQLEQMEIPLKELIFESTRFFQNQANAKDIEFKNLISEDLKVVSDPNILRIAINNIIDNAIKFTHSGSIEFTALENEERILLNVKDNGQGIDEDRLAELNDGVYSSSMGTNNEEGKGFGLSAIKKLLSEMGGTLRLDSKEGVGTTVSLFLPKDS